ncbi:MAG: glycosyl hydrolase family 18 protein [Fimbriimonadaceae bacterium]
MVAYLACLAMAASPKLSGWLVFYDGGMALKNFAAHADLLDTVGAEWYQCAADGSVKYVDVATPDKRAAALAIAHRYHVTLLGMIQNPGFDPLTVEGFLSDPVKREAHAMAVVAACLRDRLDGIDLDYESLKAADRDNFSDFVDALAAELHAKHKLLAVSLHAKTSEPGTWDGPEAQDWARIGAAADRVRVMCYDQHWETSEAGPVASIAWVEPVMRFAVSVIPAAKLDIGIPGYGYDWVGKKGADLDWTQFSSLPGSAKAVRDAASQELVLSHGDATAWFCDAAADVPKFELARTLGVRGVCLWQLGCVDPKFWPEVQSLRSKAPPRRQGSIAH